MSNLLETNSECCPKFDPKPWDDKIIEWNDKKFIKDSVCTFFFMPINFGKVIKKIDKKVSDAGAKSFDWVCLSEHTSKWNMDIHLAIDREIPGAEITILTGKFYSKVYEGNFKDTGKWMKDYDAKLETIGYKRSRIFMWYTTCPKCAKKYGKNYVVIISQIQ